MPDTSARTDELDQGETLVVSAGIATEFRTRQLSVGAAEVTFYDSVESNGDRPTIVLVHGTGGSTAAHYSFLFPMLAADQRVVSVDLSPTGSDTLELSSLVAQIAAVIRQVDAPALTLAGYSLGAVAAAATAAAHPDLVDNLVLIAGWMRTDKQQLLRNDVWAHLRRTDQTAAQQFSVFTAYSGAFLALRTADEVRAMADAVTFDEFKDQQMDLNRRIDITDTVSDIDAKTLVVGCRDDFMVPSRHSRSLFGAIVNASYVEIGAGHAVVRERPAELVHWISTFNAYPERFPAGSILPSIRP